jgi:hypothetical protein
LLKVARMTLADTLKAAIRTIPDYPKPGIMFRDITTLLGDARAFRRAVDELVHPYAGGRIDKVAGMEAQNFWIFSQASSSVLRSRPRRRCGSSGRAEGRAVHHRDALLLSSNSDMAKVLVGLHGLAALASSCRWPPRESG